MLLCELSGITGDEMGYSLFYFYILGPAVELLCGFSAGKKRGYQWFFPLTGIFNWFIPFFLFGGRFITAEWISLTLIAAVTAILDLLAEAFSVKNTELVQDLK